MKFMVYTYDQLAGEVQDKVIFLTYEEAEMERRKRQQRYDDDRSFKEAFIREVE